jgi:Protein of unknown function (DUF3604)
MLKEVVAEGIGYAVLEPDKPVVAGSGNSLKLIYHTGERGLKTGGSIRITIPHGFTSPQVDEFQKDGFVTAQCPDRDVSLSLKLVSKIFCAYQSELGHSGAFGKSIFILLENGELLPGDRLEVTYGNIFYYGGEPWGPKPPKAPELSAAHEFTVAVDPDGARRAPVTGYYLLEQSPVLRVLPGKPEKLLPLVPSTTESGHTIRMHVITVDRYLNPIEDRDRKFLVEIGGKKEVFAGRKGEIKLPPLEPGTEYQSYRVSRLRGKAVAGISNPVRSGKYQEGWNLYWGDIHAHTIYSDGLGSPDELLAFARDTAGLDFAAVTDHDDIGPYLSMEQWQDTGRAVAAYHESGRFVTFLGYEYRSELADMNVYYPGDDGPLMCGKKEEWDNPSKILPVLKRNRAMIIPHQHFGADWRGIDPQVYRVMEVYSQHGSAEYPGCPRQIPYLTGQLQKTSTGNMNATFQETLSRGIKLGVTAGSDSHAGRPGLSNWTRVGRTYNGGLTAVFAEEKTRSDIWKALYERRCYGTTGPRIYLEFSVNGRPMGSELRAEKRELNIYCIGVRPLAIVEVIKNNRVIHSVSGSPVECFFAVDDLPEKEEDFYYIRLTQDDGEMAWSSPIWVKTPGKP